MLKLCPHREKIDPATHIGVCKLCGQEKRYDPYNHEPPVIIKRGRVPDDPPPVIEQEVIEQEVIEQEIIEQEIKKEETKVAKESTDSVLKPDNWPRMKLWQRKNWYDDHKQEMQVDLVTIGPFETRRRWGTPYSTLDGLLKRWGEPPLVRTGRGKPAPQVSKEPVVNEEPVVSEKVPGLLPIPMPLFPPFDKAWNEAVQVEWLRSYVEIVNPAYPRK